MYRIIANDFLEDIPNRQDNRCIHLNVRYIAHDDRMTRIVSSEERSREDDRATMISMNKNHCSISGNFRADFVPMNERFSRKQQVDCTVMFVCNNHWEIIVSNLNSPFV